MSACEPARRRSERSEPKRVSASRFFEAVAGRYDRSYALPRDASRARMARVIAHLATPREGEPSRILDLGVGTGRELSSLQDAGHVVVGLDASPSMLERCARRARPVELVRADFWERLPFSDGSFDGVLALHGSLAHPEREDDLPRLAREAHRVLRPRGVLVIEAPSPTWLARIGARREERDDDELTLERIGEDRFLHVDRALNLAVEGIVLDEARWRDTLRPFEVVFDTASPDELLVVARRVR